MGSSRPLPGPYKPGVTATVDRKSQQGLAPHRKATRSPRARPQSSIPELLDGEARYRILADQTKDGILLIDAGNRRILDVNPGALHLTGYDRSDLIGALISKLVAREDRQAQRNRVAATPTQESLVSQARYRRKDGSHIDVEIRERRLADGRILAVIRGASQGGLAEGQYGQVLTRFDLLVATFDRDGRISYANAAMSALTGWSLEELIGRDSSHILPTGPSSGKNQPLSSEFWAGNLQRLITTEIVTRSGETRKVAVSATLLQDQYGENVGAAIWGQDISQGRAALTELKREIRERAGLATAIARLQPGETTEVTARAICKELRGLRGVDLALVVAFGADGSATVLASDAPDDISQEVAAPAPPARMSYLIERAVMGPWVERWKLRVEDGDYGAPLARAGLHSFSYAPIRYADRTLGLLAVGSLRRDNGDAVHDDLPVIAEFGPAASALLGVDLHANQLADQLRGRLHEITETDAFHPVFQPVIDVETGLVVGYEALTRFADGEPPSARFSAAWSVGAGVELELATLDRAIRVGRDLPSGRWLSVNVSPRLLTHVAELRAVLKRGNRPLILEITEHVKIPDYGAVRTALQRFSPARVSVDDAGSGFTNFAHIVDLQPDFVKIDIGLVRGVDTDLARQAMIAALCHFARNTGCQLIAEGVETRDEARTIKSLGVTFGQGYWYGRPSEVDAFSATPKADLVTSGH
ncbi:MAG: EAL domain-containing protein [Candidatus Dormiibacterota bacterium]